MIRKWLLFSTAFFAITATGLQAQQYQRSTIPDLLARAGKSVERGMTVPSGVAPSVDEVLAQADTVVRGVVGQPRSYMSDDQRDVYTDYPVLNPIILYQAQMVTSPTPGVVSAVIVTLLGGTVTVNGLAFIVRVDGLPSLQPGAEGLFLLKRDGDKYRIAGTIYGAFRIVSERLVPLTRQSEFAPEYRDIPAAQAQEQLVSKLRQR